MATNDADRARDRLTDLTGDPGLGDVPGLGDLAESFFKSLGITEERYQAVKVKLHLDPKCNCADRRRWLNEVGARLGVDGVVVKLARWMDRGRAK